MTNQIDLKSLPVAQLFSLMTNNEKFTGTSLRAYYEFEERYEKVLYNICKAVCKKDNFHKIIGLEKDVYRISMQEIYLKSNSFEESLGKVSKELQDELLIGWFSRIAEVEKEKLTAEKRKFEKINLVVPDYHDHLEELKIYQLDNDAFGEAEKKKDIEEDLYRRRKEIYDRVWVKLKPRERDILLEYFSIKGGRKYLSEDRIAYLCAKWKITLDNLQHIKRRAFQKLERFCEDEQKKTENAGDPLNS
jgi:hypothetical protein